MTLIIENGAGIVNANSYVTEAFALDYLTTRLRQTENSWDTLTSTQRDGHLIAGADYMENRFGLVFRGQKQFRFLNQAKGELAFTGQPADGETVTINTDVYTFNTTIGGVNSILIGANTPESVANLVAGINANGTEGTQFGLGTVASLFVTAVDFEGNVVVVTALNSGLAANSFPTTDTVTNAAWVTSTLTGGTDGTFTQGLSFPRINIFDRDGTHIRGVPVKVQQAQVEYAVRAAAGSPLVPDPTFDLTGGVVTEKLEKIDVITERTKYLDGAKERTFRVYPAADNLLAEFIETRGTLVRA